MDIGRVIRTEEGFAFIEMEIGASCRSCSNKGVCMADDKPVELKIEDTLGLQSGDLIEIDLPPQTKLSAGFLLFIFPLLSMIVSYYIAFRIWGTEEAGMLGALAGFALGIIDLMLFNRLAAKKRYFTPRSIKKIPK